MRANEFITESNAQEWIDKIYSQYQDWPYGRGDKVMVWGSGDDQQFAVFALKPVPGREDIIDIDWFQAHPQRQGVGSRAMAELQRLAQADGIRLKLFPWDKGQVSQTALKRFYKRAGFKPIAKGATSMQWEPELDEYINKSVLKPGWKDTQTILDGRYRLEAEVREWANKPTLFVHVYDDQATDWEGNPKPKEAGYTRFVSRGLLFKDLVASMVYVNPDYRRQGIASAMYKYAHGLGNTIKPSTAQLTPGKELWKGIKAKGGVDQLEEELLDESLRDWIAALALTGAMAMGDPALAARASQIPQTQSVEQVSAVMAKPAAQVLKKAAIKAGIVGTELAQFMAQCAHETANFSTLKEIGGKLDFKKYDPKHAPKKAKALGNVKPGDGAKYAGRGYIQLTGRDNYKRAGQALGLPLEQKPELVERPEVAAQVAVWFWKNRVAPKVDSFHDTKQVTKPINPGMRGIADRQAKFNAIKQGALATPKDMAPRGRRI